MIPSVLATVLFWTAALAVVVAQVMILRSTRRVLRAAGRPPLLEWGFALGPAVLLVLVLLFSWRTATRPPVVDVRVGPVALADVAGPRP